MHIPLHLEKLLFRPRRLRLSWRLGLTLTVIIVLAAAAQTLLYWKTREETVQEAEASYQTLAKAIEVAATQIGPEGWKDPHVLADYRDKLKVNGLRDIQITEAGKPFSESLPLISPGGKKKAKQPEIKNILITGVVGEGTMSSVLQLPLVVEGRFLGWVKISYSLENIRDLVAENFRRRLYALFGVFALGLAMMLFVARDVAYPIERIAEAANRVAEGDLDVRVPAGREDEIGRLAQSFNQMTEKLKERQELELRLIRAEKRAELGQLASGLAHEIKNPLNSLSLGLDVLRRRHRPEEDAAAAEYNSRIQGMRSEIDRLARLINSFLTFGRPLNLNRTPVDLTEIVRTVVSDLEELAHSARVTMRVEILATGDLVDGDPGLLKSVVWNLVQNAVQALERHGGEVLIHVMEEPNPKSPEARLKIEVADDGPGILESDLPLLFEPYFSTKEGGIGLGLAMTRRIVEEHGGTISARNREDARGAIFTVLLPVRRAGASSGSLAQ